MNTTPPHSPGNPEYNRRDFLRGGSLAALMTMLGAVELRADEPNNPNSTVPVETKRSSPPVNCAVIGCGAQGREILNTLGRLPNAPVVAICDIYEPMLRRAKEAAPKAQSFTDYRQVLALAECPAVMVATPSHLHRQIVLDALAAGKHVYCEAPIAHTIDDARTMAQAAKGAIKQNFQAGLQYRADKQHHFVLQFLRSGATGRTIKARAQWHKKQSWARTSPNPDREKEMNWRLRAETSPGLIGELGIHQVDKLAWFLKELPVAVSGFGSVMLHNDGRDVPDTVEAVFEFPSGALVNFEATLGNSYETAAEVLYGSDATVLMRDTKAWMFKEADAPLLGWEVYAKKDEFYQQTGIVLAASASKILSQTKAGSQALPSGPPALEQSLDTFIYNTYLVQSGVEDFAASFNIKDTKALKEYLDTLEKDRQPAAGIEEGFQAAVMALKANEAIQKKQKIVFDKQWFQI